MEAQVTDEIRAEIQDLIDEAYAISRDVGREVEELVREGVENPLSQEEAEELLKILVTTLRQRAEARGDRATAAALSAGLDQITHRIMQARARIRKVKNRAAAPTPVVQLIERNGVPIAPVKPVPWFHGIKVPLDAGHIKTEDIQLWDRNDRLDIHLGQFRRVHGRGPTSEELLEILLNKANLPGLETDKDEFEIAELARSIANNGVRKAPIIDQDGTLLDGNRRVAACFLILNSDDFTAEEKKRVEYLHVWQLTKYATDEERYAVVVSLNFENDCKQQWPEYVKARKIYEAWQAVLAAEPRSPGVVRERELKRDLSQKFALGKELATVNRYIKMVEMADDFEEYLVNEKRKDEYEVKHRANEKFQYFDELSKGTKPGGVAYTLEQDPSYKKLVFDLLYEDKFRNWTLIRKLKYYDDDVRALLDRAREEKDPDEAEALIDQALTDASNRRRETRVVGANARIETFAEWLEDLPITAFQKEVLPENLKRLINVLRLVEAQATVVSGGSAS